jgi:PBP1b-binding outer membrane lipoprotein LpoB
MKNARVALLTALLLFPLGLSAQTAPTATQIQPARQATAAQVQAQRVEPVVAAPLETVVEPTNRVNTDVVDPQGTIDKLRAKNRALKDENNRLKNEVMERDRRIAEFTSRGGSAVRAYCESENVSRNTAGATQDCGWFACNPVSGLCYTQCTLTEHCSTGACLNGYCATQAPEED